MKYQQATIRNSEGAHQTVFLESGAFKLGNCVTLSDSDDPKEWWLVIDIFDKAIPEENIKDSHDSKNWYKKDHLRKVEGLHITKK